MVLTIEAAKRAKREARERGVRRSNADDYVSAHGKFTPSHQPDVPDEVQTADAVADPPRVDNTTRRQTRVAHDTYDVDNLPKPLVECGCGECSDDVDPLADGVFHDVSNARDDCPEPRPVTVEKAAEAYLTYQKAAFNRPDYTSLFEATKARHGQLMGAERELLGEWGDDVSTALLSRRLSPVRYVNNSHGREPDRREWIPPTILDNRLHDSWRNVYDSIRYHLDPFEWEYVRVTATTTTAATPHEHTYLLVRDPADELTVDNVRPAIESHVRNTRGAYPEDHPVEDGESDAAIVMRDPPMDYPKDEQILHNHRESGETALNPNTTGMQYVLHQRPHWALKNVYDGTSDVHNDSVYVDGAAIAWALPNQTLSTSGGF